MREIREPVLKELKTLSQASLNCRFFDYSSDKGVATINCHTDFELRNSYFL